MAFNLYYYNIPLGNYVITLIWEGGLGRRKNVSKEVQIPLVPDPIKQCRHAYVCKCDVLQFIDQNRCNKHTLHMRSCRPLGKPLVHVHHKVVD